MKMTLAILLSAYFYAVDANGLIVAYSSKESTLSYVTANVSGSAIVEDNRTPEDFRTEFGYRPVEEGISTVERVNGVFQLRDTNIFVPAIDAADRARVLREAAPLFDHWKTLESMKSLDNSAVTTAEVDAAEAAYNSKMTEMP